MEIAANIHWIEPVRANVYACIEQDDVTLIDTGLASIDRVDLIFNYLERLNLFPLNLRNIVLTHADVDHVGNLATILGETGATVWCSPATRDLIMAGKHPNHLPGPAQWLADRLFKPSPIEITNLEVIEPGMRRLPILGGLQVVPTPGHTLDHFSYFHPSTGVLFAGDALHTRQNQIQCSAKRISADYNLARQSALRLVQLTPTVIACGHGKPIRTHTNRDLLHFRNALI